MLAYNSFLNEIENFSETLNIALEPQQNLIPLKLDDSRIKISLCKKDSLGPWSIK